MTRSLNQATIKKKNRFAETMAVAGKKKESLEAITSTDVEELPAELKSQILYIKDSMLLDDPENIEFYGQDDISLLTAEIKEHGFQGVIIAYPIKSGKYMIESGHRRRAAGRSAGLDVFPVLPSTPPTTEWERRLRLFRGNLHGRKETPMVIARIAQGLYDSHSEELKYKKENGLLKKDDILNVNELVANDLEFSRQSVEKYRALNRLIPELQGLADSELYSWSDLSAASSMSPELQMTFYTDIKDRSERYGTDSVDRKWLKARIKSLKIREINEKTEGISPKKRSLSGTKVVIRSAQSLHSVLDYDAIYKEEEIPYVISVLEELQGSISRKLEEFRKMESADK